MARRQRDLAREVRVEDRRRAVTEMVKAGATYREIVRALRQQGIEISLGTVSNDVAVIRDRIRAQTTASVADARALDLARVDGLLVALSERVSNGSVPHVRAYLHALEFRAKVYGYAEPQTVRHVGDEQRPVHMVQHEGAAPLDLTAFSDEELQALVNIGERIYGNDEGDTAAADVGSG